MGDGKEGKVKKGKKRSRRWAWGKGDLRWRYTKELQGKKQRLQPVCK